MAILFFNENVTSPKIGRRLVIKWINKVVALEGKSIGEISFIFCSDEYLLEVNKKYLAHDYYTDVITFDYTEGQKVNGDILISIDRVKENSISFSTKYMDELNRVMIHGVLHLLGYKDKTKKQKFLMTVKENIYLNERLSN